LLDEYKSELESTDELTRTHNIRRWTSQANWTTETEVLKQYLVLWPLFAS
jgi:hypothetical protein